MFLNQLSNIINLKAMNCLLDKLKDPRLVAKFQQTFGVQPLSQLSEEEKKRVKHVHRTYSNTGPLTQIPYVIRNQFFYYLFCFGASLGYEIFYGSFFPFWFWNVDGWVGRRLILIWALVMYIGQALKDIIRWKRPQSPPVIVLEPEYAIEYGMPSTHAMAGFSLPACIFVFTLFRYEYPSWIGLILALSWCALVCGSRLYLGMHSLLDIAAGLFISAILLVVLLPLVDYVDHLHLKSTFSPLISFPIVLLMAIYYPKSDRWTPARGDTCVIIGSCFGVLTGSWLNYQLGIISGPGTSPPFPILWPGKEALGLCLLRAVIGVVLLVAVRAIGKLLSYSLLCSWQKLNPHDPTTKKHALIELPVKLITYTGVGMNITFLSPAVFRYLDIERITMFTEV